MENSPYLLDTNRELEGKRILVTGGTRGIGRSVVLRLHNAGAKVTAAARTAPQDLPDNVEFIQADISKPEGTEKIIRETFEKLGGLDILINNAGGSSTSTAGALALSDEDWLTTFNANLFPPSAWTGVSCLTCSSSAAVSSFIFHPSSVSFPGI